MPLRSARESSTLGLEPSRLSGSILAPLSKSSQQRAVACSTLASGSSLIRGQGMSADTRAALSVAQAMGARVGASPLGIEIEGSPLFSSPRETGGDKRRLVLHCGESGLCMRMFSPIAALLGVETELGAEGSLRSRPMGMVVSALESMGVSASSDGGHPPLLIRGPIKGGEYRIDAGGSSQFLTGLLIALPMALEDSRILVDNPVSSGYLDLTIDTCAAFGVEIERIESGREFRIRGSQAYSARDFRPEGDWSGAAFPICAAAAAGAPGGLRILGLDPRSSQPDRAVLDAARLAGAELEWESGGALLVRPGRLAPFSFDASECPDLFPPLTALAAACPGRSRIAGTARLASKESDRALSLLRLLGGFGLEARAEEGVLEVEGGRVGRRGPEPARVDSAGDHRIAMAAAVLSLSLQAPVEIEGWECVSKSWPSFFEDMAGIGLKRRV